MEAGAPTGATDATGLEGAGFWGTLRFAITNPWQTTKIVVGSVAGDVYQGGKALVTGEAGAALGDRAVAIVEKSSGSQYRGTAGQNVSVAKELGLELIGVTKMAEGIAGADAATGQQLSDAERIQRGANGLGAYAGTAAGGAALVSKVAPTTNLVVTSRGVQALETRVPTFSKLPGSGLLGRTVGKCRTAPKSVKGTLDGLPGKTGKTGPIKELPDAKALDDLFDSLSKGGKTVNPGTYRGVVKELPDGTIVRMRTGSKSGGATLDITMPDGTIIKVHIK